MAAVSMTDGDDTYDLLIVIDATGSMGQFIKALNASLPEIISLSALTGCFQRIGIVAYRDYNRGKLIEWSGWCSPSGTHSDPGVVSQERVLDMARNLSTAGGGGSEATKTGLAQAYQQMRGDATTIVLLYTDISPHFTGGDREHTLEQAALNDIDSYGGTGHLFADWVSAANTLKSGPKKAVVFSIMNERPVRYWSPYLYLSTVTGGAFLAVNETTPTSILQLTLGVLLAWMGAGQAVAENTTKLGVIRRYIDSNAIGHAENETDSSVDLYFKREIQPTHDPQVEVNVDTTSITLMDIPNVMKVRGPCVRDFAKRYVEDEDYKKLAVDQLQRIISTNVSAISVNPIFGTLWRTVCNDRNNEARNDLVTMFGLEVDRIQDTNDRSRMKAWLEESYNYAEEIEEQIAAVAPHERYPLVYLDPTMDFAQDGPLNRFTRDELLEIGRSCDYRILQRLGKVLTRLSYVEKGELPDHIKVGKVPCIPMALADPRYDCQFWKILLHAVLPGTRITPRPAALLAALALRMCIVPLRDVADRELIAFRSRWNTLEIPETWNVSCLNLLLKADTDYETRVSQGITQRPDAGRILMDEDRKLFKALVDYKMLDNNLKGTIEARVGWSPKKNKAAVGPLVTCRVCQYPRSVTIMGVEGICGLCHASIEFSGSEKRLRQNVSKDHDETSQAYWVECKQTHCRAQYVVYNPETLGVRAKCFYCRHNGDLGAAPAVECTKCLSRIIWPEEYRPKDLDLDAFECAACNTGVTTVVNCETTVEQLGTENGRDWLLKANNEVLPEPLNGRSLFYTASHCDLQRFPTEVKILPESALTLTISGKPIMNQPEIMAVLKDRISQRRSQRGTCTLCFESIRKDLLQAACGRSGCHQLICSDCKKGWYGINLRGHIINVAALSCPFCRRRPGPKAVRAFGLALLGNLRSAVEDSGSWIYAWCSRCGFAKQYMERECAAGAPPEIRNWQCEDCHEEAAFEVQAKGESREPRIRFCPGCGVATQKMSGCDHISCTCGAHWCYSCGEAVPLDVIYTHMSDEHGGLWEPGVEDDWEYDE